MDFAVSADHIVKIEESQKIDKYLSLARKLKKLRNMKITVIKILVDALRMVTRSWKRDRGIGNQKKNRYPLHHSTVKISKNT